MVYSVLDTKLGSEKQKKKAKWRGREVIDTAF